MEIANRNDFAAMKMCILRIDLETRGLELPLQMHVELLTFSHLHIFNGKIIACVPYQCDTSPPQKK